MVRRATIDYSAFQDEDGNEIIKELTVVDLDTKCEQHWIFKCPPDSYNRWTGPVRGLKYNSWVSTHFHGLDFQYGFSEYESLLSALECVCAEIQLLYAADSEKARGLEKLFQFKRTVFSLGSLGCPPMLWNPLPPAIEEEEEEHVGEDCVDGSQKVSRSSTVVSEQRQCLYHSLFARRFFCSRSRAHYLADWCIKNPTLIDMNDPDIREKTFVDWKLNKPSARDLAEYGFVRSSSFRDTTKCVYCTLSLHQWKEGDDADEDHYYNAPFCKFHRYQMQLMCEQADEELKNRKKVKTIPKGSCFQKRSGVLNKETQTGEGMSEEREAFLLRYGDVADLTWDQVKDYCAA